jgi:hypothetical protein
MPVYRFRSFEEIEALEKKGGGVKWRFSPDESYWRKALAFIPSSSFPKGVFRFRSFEEANEWEFNHLIRQAHERTKRGPSRGL